MDEIIALVCFLFLTSPVIAYLSLLFKCKPNSNKYYYTSEKDKK